MRKTITVGRVKGSMWYSGTEFPVSDEKNKVLENDMFFNTNDYKVYQYIDVNSDPEIVQLEWVEQLELTEVFSSYISDEKALVGEEIKFVTSEDYDVESDNEIPTTKAVALMVNKVDKNKLDKSKTPNTLYGVNEKGEQQNFTFSYDSHGYTIPNRDASGQLKVPEIPTNDLHAVSKKYVDTFVINNVSSIISLGEIGYPGVVNNEKLNAVTKPGVYTFTSTNNYSGGTYVVANVYFMVVEKTDIYDRAVEQFIYSCDISQKSTETSILTIIKRIKSKSTGTWTVSSIAIPSQEYVDKQIAKLIAEEVDSSPETLNTIKELSDALKENNDVVDALNKAIINKADKTEVKDMIDNAITKVLNEEV